VYIDVLISVAEPHQSDAAPVLGKNVYAAPAPAAIAPAPATTAPAPTLLYTKPTYLKQTKVINRISRITTIFSSFFFLFKLLRN
jgi:hypothetical protein